MRFLARSWRPRDWRGNQAGSAPRGPWRRTWRSKRGCCSLALTLSRPSFQLSAFKAQELNAWVCVSKDPTARRKPNSLTATASRIHRSRRTCLFGGGVGVEVGIETAPPGPITHRRHVLSRWRHLFPPTQLIHVPRPTLVGYSTHDFPNVSIPRYIPDSPPSHLMVLNSIPFDLELRNEI